MPTATGVLIYQCMFTDYAKAGECGTRYKRESEDDKESPECKIFNPSRQLKVKTGNRLKQPNKKTKTPKTMNKQVIYGKEAG